MKFFFIFIDFFLMSVIFAYSQSNKLLSIAEYQAIDSNFYYSLDFIMQLDSSCNFFSDTTCYSIVISDTFYMNASYIICCCESHESINHALSRGNMLIGYIEYKKKIFFIDRRSAENALKKILTLTGDNKAFIKLKDCELIEDDSMPMRFVGFYNGNAYYLYSIHDDIRCK